MPPSHPAGNCGQRIADAKRKLAPSQHLASQLGYGEACARGETAVTKVQLATGSGGSLPPRMLCMLRSPGKPQGAWLMNGARQIPANGRPGSASKLRGSRQQRPAPFSLLCAHGNTGQHGAIDMGRISFVPALLRLQCSYTQQTWYPELQGAYHELCLPLASIT